MWEANSQMEERSESQMHFMDRWMKWKEAAERKDESTRNKPDL